MFQPQVAAGGGGLVAAEALLRSNREGIEVIRTALRAARGG